MSQYTIITSFVTKDSLASGNPAKLVKGADFTTEFTAVQTAVNSKVDGFGVIVASAGPANALVIGATGLVTLAAASSGATLALNTLSAGITETHSDGTNSGGFVGFDSSHNLQVGCTGAFGVELSTNGVVRLVANSAGNVTVNAPTSGNALTVNGQSITGVYAQVVKASGTTNGQAFGLQIQAGVGSTDVVLELANQANTLNYLFVLGDGSVVVGNSGTGEGIGTLNAANGLYIAGNQLFFGVPPSASTTAAVTDVGKCIVATGTVSINNAVFSQGHAFSIYNNSASAISIAGTVTTMRLAGTASTGARTLAARGIATVWMNGASEAIVGGPGVS